jgi:endoglucanase
MHLSLTRRTLRPRFLAAWVGGAALAMSALPAAVHATRLAARAPGPVAHAAVRGCAQRYPATRDPANPLDLAQAPGSNPLNGAQFFVPGPENGNAASAIAQLVGINPADLSPSESWASFDQKLQSGRLHHKLTADPSLAHQVGLLSTIASQPQAQRISSFSWGGTPDGIYKQTTKVFCSLMTGDPGTIPIFTTYFLHATLGGSPTPAQVRRYMPLFKRRVDAMAKATGKRPSVWLLEIDGIGSTRGVQKTGALPLWEKALHYEMLKMQSLPHTVVYVEGGYSDSNSVGYTARVLKKIGIHRIRGFFTNDTHNQWTVNEDRWASKIVKRVGGTHFIVNTSNNGRGPKLNPHPMTEGVENNCNPPGRGIGIRDTTDTGVSGADAYLWEHTPGQSSGCGGGPSGGTFWPAYAEGLVSRADDLLGPGMPDKRR